MENNTETNSANPGFLKRTWSFLRKPSAKYSVLGIAATSIVVGAIFWDGFHTALEKTNNLQFCIGCHEMHDNVYQEYKKTIHYSNRTGVRAECPDCHVPTGFISKMHRKLQASNEIWSKLMGHVDTPEKFEARRMELATHEWDRMKASGSRECRNCHEFEAMSGEVQKVTVYKKHMKAKDDGQTCIDCHKGIAHKLPKEYRDPDEE